MEVLPHAEELELAVLGAVMLEKNVFVSISNIITAECFYFPKNELVYQACQALFDKSEPIDILTVTNELRSTKKLTEAGGANYITSLTNRVASAANVEYHAHVIREKYSLRKIIEITQNATQQAFDSGATPQELTRYIGENISKISSLKKKEATIDIGIKSSLERMETVANSEDTFSGIPYGIRELDKRTRGAAKGHLVIVGARPSMGKTSFLTSVASHMSFNLNKPTVIFSLETSLEDLTDRFFCNTTQIPIDKIANGTAILDPNIDKGVNKMKGKPLYIDTDKDITIFDMRAKLAMYKLKYGIETAFIDFVQLMKIANEKHNRNDGVGEITRGLKIAALELDISIIALAQLSRGVEDAPESRPSLKHLRDSGNIEQDADEVLFLYRPCYYGLHDDERYAEIKIAKHKTAPTGWLDVKFIGETMTYTDQDDLNFFNN